MKNQPSKESDNEMDARVLRDLLNEAGLCDDLTDAQNVLHADASPTEWSKKQWTMALIAGGIASFNVVALISLIPVLRGRGAPYLPTKRTNLDRMFAQLRPLLSETCNNSKSKPTFVDLGSGDGRVVFRAARENMFSNCTGYEINPLLHGFAQLRKTLTPKYWRTTSFALGDIWKVDLTKTDVVAVVRLAIAAVVTMERSD
jgi:hypothetical protein